MTDDLLAEQKAYYRLRAPEYDDWWQRTGRYEGEEAERSEWAAQVAVVEQVLADFAATGDVLELAGGTGWWTERLATTARTLTVVDSSPETLAINRQRVGDADHVRYVVADIFEWEPDRAYDAVFFSFWFSHVPRERVDGFLDLVARCAPRLFLIDNRADRTRRSKDPYVVEYRHDVHLRTVTGGGEYRVVKVMYEPDELERLLRERGWRADITGTRWFVYGSATIQKSSEESSGTV